MSTRFSRRWHYFIGDSSNFSLENRAFNAVSILTLLIMVILITSNFFLNYDSLLILCFSIFFLQLFFYYLSRFRKKFSLASWIYVILSYPVMGAFYFLNAGKSGPAIYGFFLTFLLIVIITSPKWHRLLILTHILVVLSLFAAEYLFPQWVPDIYGSRAENFIDLAITFILAIVFIYFCTSYLRKSYLEEKNLAESRARSIEEHHHVMLVQKDELKKLNLEKDRLFSIVAHDLRSPLASIQGYLESMGSEKLTEGERKFLETELLKLTRNTSSMLNNLLQWSSSQIKGDVHLKPVLAHQVFEECLSLQLPTAEQKGVTIKNNILQECQVLADANMLELVVRNLINNAIKFTSAGDRIVLECKTTQNEVHLSISDTGVGIPELKQKDIFTSQVKSARGTNHETGIGLGLKLCYDFLTKMGGEIQFSSLEGKGTTFTLILQKPKP